jgi:hypothetical protein
MLEYHNLEPCILIDRFERFGESFCPSISTMQMGTASSSENLVLSTNVFDVTFQKSVMLRDDQIHCKVSVVMPETSMPE